MSLGDALREIDRQVRHLTHLEIEKTNCLNLEFADDFYTLFVLKYKRSTV